MNVQLPIELHRASKAKAAKRGTSLQQWVADALAAALRDESARR